MLCRCANLTSDGWKAEHSSWNSTSGSDCFKLFDEHKVSVHKSDGRWCCQEHQTSCTPDSTERANNTGCISRQSNVGSQALHNACDCEKGWTAASFQWSVHCTDDENRDIASFGRRLKKHSRHKAHDSEKVINAGSPASDPKVHRAFAAATDDAPAENYSRVRIPMYSRKDHGTVAGDSSTPAWLLWTLVGMTFILLVLFVVTCWWLTGRGLEC